MEECIAGDRGRESRDDMTTNFELSTSRTENAPNDEPNETHDGEYETDDGAEPVERGSRTVGTEMVLSISVVRDLNVFTE